MGHHAYSIAYAIWLRGDNANRPTLLRIIKSKKVFFPNLKASIKYQKLAKQGFPINRMFLTEYMNGPILKIIKIINHP